ncbi:hypothetical protein GCM10010294_34330 [Streptomyces griseoloalbus]|uniref:hypothetical protein n=1 Tax=Streptomyces griseoloalbus TaxID=67303 RepID=UPI0018764147|nr:hypothetical protein GCM10010294_34330 [Streptomyces griseoloalbus]
MHTDLSPVIAATAQWLTRSFPTPGGALASALCEAQARQAVTVAARLRYPTAMDAALVGLAGPGGSARLDWVTGADSGQDTAAQAWRTWVDEVVASWAACLLADPALASAAVTALTGNASAEFRRLLTPDASDRHAAALLRHPDLLAPVATLHHSALLARLDPDSTLVP